jgi:hypothetical protein
MPAVALQDLPFDLLARLDCGHSGTTRSEGLEQATFQTCQRRMLSCFAFKHIYTADGKMATSRIRVFQRVKIVCRCVIFPCSMISKSQRPENRVEKERELTDRLQDGEVRANVTEALDLPWVNYKVPFVQSSVSREVRNKVRNRKNVWGRPQQFLNTAYELPIALAVCEKTLFACVPISRMVPTTITRITANITAYSAMSSASLLVHTACRSCFTFILALTNFA